ncbi:hypothetical protein ACF0H5_000680 [Mactra antiquata]
MTMFKLSTLVTSKALAESLDKFPNKLRVLDATWFLPNSGRNGFKNYKEGHIPGAVFFDIDECSAKSDYEHMLPSESQFADYVGNLGIDNDTHVVVYNDNPEFALFSAPRVWWTFKVFGHHSVSILNGGLKAWKDDRREIVSGVESVPKKSFKAKLNTGWIKSYEDMVDNIKSKKFQVIDARSSGRFHGTQPEPRQDTKPGHIPGSYSIPFTNILAPYTSPDGTVLEHGSIKSVEELKNTFNEAGVDLNSPLTASCGSGVTACCLVFAAYLCNKETCVYDGSWLEWYKRSTPDLREQCPE